MKNEVRRYLLGQLTEAEEERLELRLLTEPAFIEEFDTIVDEITDQYVSGELPASERKQVEKYFLTARQRRDNANFASTLINHAAAARKVKAAPVVEIAPRLPKPGWWERLWAFWTPQNAALRVAAATAVVVIALGLVFIAIRPSGPQHIASIELRVSSSDRAEGPQSERLKLAPDTDAVSILLHVPESSTQYANYRVEMVTQDGTKRFLEVGEQNPRTVTALVPADMLPRGRYALNVFGVRPDGNEERLPDTYFLTVE